MDGGSVCPPPHPPGRPSFPGASIFSQIISFGAFLAESDFRVRGAVVCVGGGSPRFTVSGRAPVVGRLAAALSKWWQPVTFLGPVYPRHSSAFAPPAVP